MDNIEKSVSSEPEKKEPSGRGGIYKLAVIMLVCIMVVSAYLTVKSFLPDDSTAGTKPSTGTGSTAGTSGSTGSTSGTTGTAGQTEPTHSVTEPTPGVIDFSISQFPEEVWLVGEAARAYMAAGYVEICGDLFWHYMQSGVRQDVGLPVELSYSAVNLPQDMQVQSVVFWLSQYEDFSDYTEYMPEEGHESVLIYGLYPGTQYYCSVRIALSDGTMQVRSTSFCTAESPRVLSIDGIVNVRDFGGWKTTDGRTVQYGLLYRGSELDGAVEENFRLTEKGIAQMRELGIRTDMDLRHEGENVLGVDHRTYTAIEYTGAFTDAGKEAVRRVFSDLANPDCYPVYLHCTYGADRTGTMCYLLGALLGMSDLDLKRDYDLTGLYYTYVSDGLYQEFVNGIQSLEGDSTQEKVGHFLLSVGVTQEEIDSIRLIFLE